MANISSLAPITTTATALSNLVLVSPQKTMGYQPNNPNSQEYLNAFGSPQQPPSILFHYEGEQSVQVEADITDHWVENNSSIQDQIALKPEIITTHGFIGELTNIPPLAAGTIQTILSKLTTVSAYAPGLTTTALLAYNTAFQLYQVGANAVNSGISAYNSLSGGGGENVIGDDATGTNFTNPNGVTLSTGKVANNQTNQQVYFQQFYAYMQARWLFTVQTPWAIFTNMALMSVRPVQEADSVSLTDFELKFKKMRFVSTVTSENTQGRNGATSDLQDNGNTLPGASQSQASAIGAVQ